MTWYATAKVTAVEPSDPQDPDGPVRVRLVADEVHSNNEGEIRNLTVEFTQDKTNFDVGDVTNVSGSFYARPPAAQEEDGESDG